MGGGRAEKEQKDNKEFYECLEFYSGLLILLIAFLVVRTRMEC